MKTKSNCCSCHQHPPCDWCTKVYECDKCGRLKHPDDSEPATNVRTLEKTCSDCYEKESKQL